MPEPVVVAEPVEAKVHHLKHNPEMIKITNPVSKPVVVAETVVVVTPVEATARHLPQKKDKLLTYLSFKIKNS